MSHGAKVTLVSAVPGSTVNVLGGTATLIGAAALGAAVGIAATVRLVVAAGTLMLEGARAIGELAAAGAPEEVAAAPGASLSAYRLDLSAGEFPTLRAALAAKGVRFGESARLAGVGEAELFALDEADRVMFLARAASDGRIEILAGADGLPAKVGEVLFETVVQITERQLHGQAERTGSAARLRRRRAPDGAVEQIVLRYENRGDLRVESTTTLAGQLLTHADCPDVSPLLNAFTHRAEYDLSEDGPPRTPPASRARASEAAPPEPARRDENGRRERQG